MNDLIDRLTRDLQPAPPRQARWTVLGLMALAALVPAGVMLFVLGPRPDMAAAVMQPHFWVKLGVMALIAACAVPALTGLSRPGGRPGHGLLLAGLIAAGLLTAGLINLALTPAGARADALLGHSWAACLLMVSLFSLPLFAASVIGLRRMAPTRLRAAGLAAGLAAGGGAAAIYSFSCTETSLTFLASWYLLAVALVGLAGALLGPRLLRW